MASGHPRTVLCDTPDQRDPSLASIEKSADPDDRTGLPEANSSSTESHTMEVVDAGQSREQLDSQDLSGDTQHPVEMIASYRAVNTTPSSHHVMDSGSSSLGPQPQTSAGTTDNVHSNSDAAVTSPRDVDVPGCEGYPRVVEVTVLGAEGFTYMPAAAGDSDLISHPPDNSSGYLSQSLHQVGELSVSQGNVAAPVTFDSNEVTMSQNQLSENSSRLGRGREVVFIGPVMPGFPQTASDGVSAPPQQMMEVDTPTEGGGARLAWTEQFDFSNKAVPSFVTWAQSEYLRSGPENFLRGCKWSPDGGQVLTNSNDNVLRVFNMSDDVTENEATTDIEQLSEVVMRETSSVYDYAWHPATTSSRPDSCRIATTCSGIPIHLWDSTSGKIVASYKAYDQYDEITSAYSLSFGPSGSHVFGGYKKAIRVFDTEYPGRKCRLVKTCGPKKSLSGPAQTGIISCFAHSPATDGVFAAGSYTRHVGLYDLRCDGLTCVIEGQRGGITHAMFTPDGNLLLTGARKDNEILCWDVRNLGTVCFSALRDVRTNQRMYFDITRSGRYMTSGNDDGTVTFWDLTRSTDVIQGRTYLKPVAQFQAHADSVNGVSFHPSGRLLASASGQRHFRNFDSCDNSSCSSSNNDNSSDDEGGAKAATDFSLRIWRMPLCGDTSVFPLS